MTFDRDIPQLAFAATEICLVAAQSGATAPDVEMKIDPALGAQCYRIKRAHVGRFIVTGGDANGAMYGGLDVAEAVRLGTLADLKGACIPPTSPSGASSSTSRWTRARPVTPTPGTPPSRTSRKCGARTSGTSSWMRWRVIGTTC